MLTVDRFSEAPFFEGTMPSHRGEALVKHGRNLLKDDFDHVSLHSIQAYILQCTYWLVFGAARKSWLYLGMFLTTFHLFGESSLTYSATQVSLAPCVRA